MAAVARSIAPPQITRYDQLLAANSEGALTDTERAELSGLLRAAEQLIYCKAYAALLLRWRGERIPSLTELEAESAQWPISPKQSFNAFGA